MKKSVLSLILAMAMALSLLTACSSKPAPSPAPVDGGSSDTSAESSFDDGEESLGDISYIEGDAYFANFDEVLDYVQQGISNQEGEEYYTNVGLSSGFESHLNIEDEFGSIISFGWTLKDMDGDGEDELILGFDYQEEPIIFNILGRSENGVHTLVDATDNDIYGLGENDELYNFTYIGEERAYYTRYTMSEHELIPGKVLIYDSEIDAENPWRLGSSFDWDDASPVTEEEAQDIMEEFSIWPFELNVFAFG